MSLSFMSSLHTPNTPQALFNILEFLPLGISHKHNGIMPISHLRKIHCGGFLYVDAARAWNAMLSCAREDGVFLNVNSPSSAYRNISTQLNFFKARYTREYIGDTISVEFDKQLWYLKKGCTFAQIPGNSTHGFGLAVDIENAFSPRVQKWLPQHAESFGFKLEYDFEPWHWSYISKNIPQRVLDFEQLPQPCKWSAWQIANYAKCTWFRQPSNNWSCGGISFAAPFRAGDLVVVKQSDTEKYGFSKDTIRHIFRQCSGLVCTKPEELVQFNKPLLISYDIEDTINKLSFLFE